MHFPSLAVRRFFGQQYDLATLVDPDWYLERHPDVAASGADALTHFLRHGLEEGRDPCALFDTAWVIAAHPHRPELARRTAQAFLDLDAGAGVRPHPLFDPLWYVTRNPDVGASGTNPLIHYLRHGAGEGRQPSPLFDPEWYRARRPEAGRDALADYLRHGLTLKLSPSPLFDAAWYLERYPDVATAGLNPLVHYVMHGAAEGRDPCPLFDTDFYLERYADVAAAGINPLWHYLSSGGVERRAPSPLFDGDAYLRANPDVAAAALNPLVHYVAHGAAEGRAIFPAAAVGAHGGRSPGLDAALGRYAAAGDMTAATLLRCESDGLSELLEYFAPKRPISAFVDPARTAAPTLNILLPSLQARHATGGPNTAYILGALLAKAGVRVAFIATDLPIDDDPAPLRAHLRRMSGVDPEAVGIRVVDASNRRQPLAIGHDDVFMGTAWWTAHIAASAARLTGNRRILYLIQDYETLFYGASENYADAEGSYALDHFPIVNTSLLRDHLHMRGAGRFADPGFAAAAAVFEPAVDTVHFRPEDRRGDGPRRLLFYARPTVARRNAFALGVAALRAAVEAGLFGDHPSDPSRGWTFTGMGETFRPVPLGRGCTLEPAPWLDFEGYAGQMRGADVLLSLMLSPHPSYPPLEMAACGGSVVTTVFGAKTQARLAALSPRIIGVEPAIEPIMRGLSRALASPHASSNATLALPGSWTESLSTIVPGVIEALRARGFAPGAPAPRLPAPVAVVRADAAVPRSAPHYVARAAARARLYPPTPAPGLLSLITTVYDTDPAFVADLAHTVFGQLHRPDFEWLILDNGSREAGTRRILDEIARDPRVRLGRVEDNLGIVGGMRWCLERARNRYVLPVDSDDLLFPDCLSSLGAFLIQSGLPPLAYTDEDKTDGADHSGAYLKPDWDPVLFMHSCYIAHLTALDRETALALDCYGDPAAEGCHDWDSFTRFLNAGHTPAHLPEVLYAWRLHAASTSGNYRAKPYIYASHKAVLERFLAARGRLDRYAVTPAPLFGGTPDYRFAVRPDGARAPVTASVEVALGAGDPRAALAAALAAAPAGATHLRLRDAALADIDPLSEEEAAVLSDLFPDAAIVGGRIHDGARILEAGMVFGYGPGVGCPDAGRALTDPGYGAQSWKPRSVAAVSARLCHVEIAFLHKALPQVPATVSLALLGPWLGALAREAGRRVICTPHVAGRATATVALTRDELERFNARFGALRGATTGYAPHLDRSGDRPHQPATAPAVPALADYPRWLAREVDPATSAAAAPISLLTTVYIGTDPGLFLETAEAVRRQTRAPQEWLVLAHGPVQPALDAALERLAAEGLLRLLREPVNLGIHGGLRRCLEAATGDFTISVDADDLLTEDAVAAFAEAIAARPDVDVFYSDEDLLIDGAPRHPYRRPDFDPALLLAHSAIWHAIALRRETGLALGVYTGAAVEYAQDWDTLLRFWFDGRAAAHVPRIVYHWRQHPRSLSHGGAVFDGSIRSVRAALETVRARAAPEPARYAVAAYPIDLGAPSLFLRRLAGGAPPVTLIDLGPRRHGAVETDFPLAARIEADVDVLAPGGAAALVAALGTIADAGALALLAGPAVRAIDGEGLWQALRWPELLGARCAAVSGAMVGLDGRIARGAAVALDAARLADPAAGTRWGNPGPFSIAGLPHCVTLPVIDIALGDAAWLAQALRARPPAYSPRALGVALGMAAEREGRFVVHEPLLRAEVEDMRDLVGDPVEGLERSWRATRDPHAPAPAVRGVAGFLRAWERHAP